MTQLITDLTGLTNKQIKESEPFFIVFNRFWEWCQKQKANKDDKLTFYTYGNFDKVLFETAHKRRPNDKRIDYIIRNTIDIQIPIMMSLSGGISSQLSLLNATKTVTGILSLEQSHDALKDAILLKLLCDNLEPNIENLIEAEKCLYMKRLRKSFGDKKITNNNLKKFIKKVPLLKALTFEEIVQFLSNSEFKKIEESVIKNYKLLGGKELLTEEHFNSLHKKGKPE